MNSSVNTQMEDILLSWLSASSQQEFTVIIAGRIAGGSLEDAIHKPATCLIRDDIIIIEFEHGERLILYGSSSVIFEVNGELVVKDGSEARFTWYHHGTPWHPENLCEETYRKTGTSIIFQRTGPPFTFFDPFPTIGPMNSERIEFVRLVPN